MTIDVASVYVALMSNLANISANKDMATVGTSYLNTDWKQVSGVERQREDRSSEFRVQMEKLLQHIPRPQELVSGRHSLVAGEEGGGGVPLHQQ